MIVTLEWLARLQKDLPRPKRHGEVIRVISPFLPVCFINDTPAVFRDIDTFSWRAAYIDTDEGMSLRWVAEGVKVAL